jgi:ATP-binding cassette, subfamily B (MDR/TAP), member 1
LTTIIDSDAIAVIANGKISEFGDHETLLSKEGGIYRLLCESQGIKPTVSGTSDLPVAVAEVAKGTGEEVPSVNASIAHSIAQSLKPLPDQMEEGLVTEDGAGANGDDNEEEVEATEVASASMGSIWRQMGGDCIYTFLGVLGSVVVGALSPCESILTAKIVTTFYVVEAENMVEANMPYILNFLYFALASLIGNMMMGYGLSRSGSNLGSKLRNNSFAEMMKRSMGWYDQPENSTGELTTILGADIEAVEGLVGLPLGYRVRVLTSVVCGTAIALSYAYQIGLVALACVPFIMAAGMLQVCCSRKKMVVLTDGPSPPTIMEQGLRGIASVQAYNLEGKVGDDYERALEPESAGKVKSGMIAGLVFGVSQFAGQSVVCDCMLFFQCLMRYLILSTMFHSPFSILFFRCCLSSRLKTFS